MIQTGLIQHAHNDLVTDVSYDFYGLRLATCSLDQHIKVWRLDESRGTWAVEDDWKAHDAPVSKLSWAHPEFGSIIASASFDRTVKIWEQSLLSRQSDIPHQLNGTGGGSSSQSQAPNSSSSSSSSSSSRWIERAILTDARGTVRVVEFAPQHFGLKLATIASDNQLRIYECLEQPSLTTWQLSDELDVPNLPSSSSSPLLHPHALAAAAAVAAAQATPTQTSTTFDAPPASLVTQALQQGLQPNASAGPPQPPAPAPSSSSQPVARPGIGNREADGGWSISWCKDRYWGELIAVACGTNGVVKIIQLSPSRRASVILTLDSTPAPVAVAAPAALISAPENGGSTTTTTTTTNTATTNNNNNPVENKDTLATTVAATSAAAAPTTTSTAAPTTPAAVAAVAPVAAAAPPSFAVTSVAWAPSCGRSYHLIATGGRDGHVRIWRVKPSEDVDREDEDEEEEGKWTASIVADFDQHKSAVSRVEWNVTGTVLSSAGNDGRIRLWKATSSSVWRPAGFIGVEQTEENEQKDAEMEMT